MEEIFKKKQKIMRYTFEEEFRLDHPETVGETDRHFDLENYKDWLEEQLLEARKQLSSHNVVNWVAFDWNKIETRPTHYGKYLICRKDGKIHWETWNGSGWAYNHNEIRYWAEIKPPCH